MSDVVRAAQAQTLLKNYYNSKKKVRAAEKAMLKLVEDGPISWENEDGITTTVSKRVNGIQVEWIYSGMGYWKEDE